MKKKYRYYQVDAFTTEKFTGNPAGVVSNADGLSESEMQMISREVNNSETAFVLSPSSPDHDVEIRFFTPTTEVPNCGHATIAAQVVRSLEFGVPAERILQKTRSGLNSIRIRNAEPDISVEITQGPITYEEIEDAALCDRIVGALGIAPEGLDRSSPIQVVSTGHSKVIVPVSDYQQLESLQPNFKALTEISRAISCNGYFAFTLNHSEPDALSVGRMFAPAIGINEDPVTGNANGPLGAYLFHNNVLSTDQSQYSFRAKQGLSLNRPGSMQVTVELTDGDPTTVRIAGKAVIVFQSEIVL